MGSETLYIFVIYKQYTSRNTKSLQDWTSYGQTNTTVK